MAKRTERGRRTHRITSDPPMHLARIVVEGFRSCQRTAWEPNSGLSALIGRNGAGKTNLLQALTLTQKAVQPGFHGPAVGGAQQCRVSAEFCSAGTPVSLRFNISYNMGEENKEIVTAARIRWRLGRLAKNSRPWTELGLPGTRIDRLTRNEKKLYFHHFSPKQSDYFFTSGNQQHAKKVSAALNFVRSVGYYSASRFTDPSLCPSSIEIDQDYDLVRNRVVQRTHQKLLSDLYRCYRQDSEKWSIFLSLIAKHGLGLISNITWRQVNVGSSQVEIKSGGKIARQWRQRTLVVPTVQVGRDRLSFNQLSEGTFKTLALVFYLITDDNQLLLVEEPEVCVHHGLLASVVELIKQQSLHRQTMFSTHSDFVLDRLAPEQVFRVANDIDRGTTVSALADSSRQDMEALRLFLQTSGNLGDYWRQGGLS